MKPKSAESSSQARFIYHLLKVMEITINGEKKTLSEERNLAELLVHFGLPSERVAVELNREVVRKKDWQAIKVSDGDKLEVIHFVGGG
jgi:thiamine biosynthesis protein ThiS